MVQKDVQTELTPRIRSKKQLITHVYQHLVGDKAIKSITPIGLRDLIVSTTKGEYRIRVTKVKRSGRLV